MIARTAPLIEMREITKAFGPTVANNRVTLEVRPGEVHALLGENGAGKSTLMNVLSGALRADSGEVLVGGETTRFRSPQDAVRAGVGMVHQHFQLVEAFTVAQNVHLGWSGAPKMATKADLIERTKCFAEEFGTPVDPAALVWQLSVGEQQWVEILRTLSHGAQVLVLDEPTAVLGPQEADDLLERLRTFARRGRSCVFITHKLREALEHSDRITVMRTGEVVGSMPTAEADEQRLVAMMVGGKVSRAPHPPRLKTADRVLSVDGLFALGDRRLMALSDVALEVKRGEIVGVAGVAGNGQRELSEVLTGLRDPEAGSVRIDGSEIAGHGPRDFIRAGVGHIPEDRWSTGLVKGQPIWVNAAMKSYTAKGLRKGPFVSRRRLRQFAGELAGSVDLKMVGVDSVVDNLSGGNAQRLLTAREIQSATTVLIAVHPTRGLDVRASNDVRTALVGAAREKGLGILLITEDLDEVLDVSDRVLVLAGGRICGAFARDDCDREEIGLLMAGGGRSGVLGQD